MEKALIAFTLFFSGLLLLPTTAQAEANRVAWFYDRGYLVQDMRTGGWSETINAVETFYFHELQRNGSYVHLHDPTRKLDVRLYNDSMLLKGPGETQYTNFVSGHWDDRRMFAYYNSAQKQGYFLLIGGGMYRLVDQGGLHPTSTYLREIRRNLGDIQLLDPRNNVIYALHETEYYRGAAHGGGLYLESKGAWK